MKAERYYKDVPLWLRCLMCWGIQGNTYRFKWGEFSWSGWLGLGYSVYHEDATLNIQLIIFSLYIKMPMFITQGKTHEDWCASYGFCLFPRSLHLNWRSKCKVINMPWGWEHSRTSYYWPDGKLHHHAERHEWERPEEIKERHPYIYILKNGAVQNRTATVNGEEREWRWLWFMWSPWPRKIERSINVEFDDEVGDRTGSWKGGTIGCGYEWRHGESLSDALRRMEKERKF